MSFVEKVEAALAKQKKLVHKPEKPSKPSKGRKGVVTEPKKPLKPKKGPKAYRFASKALGAQKKVPQMTFAKIRRLMPKIYSLLSMANPFDAPGPSKIPDATWGQFFAKAAPELMAMLLWDLGEFEREDIPAAIRYFKQRVKT